MLVTEDGITNSCKEEQYAKAMKPILATEAEITNSRNNVQS